MTDNAPEPHTTVDIPSFDEALDRFRRLVDEQHLPGNLRWVWREEVLTRGKSSSQASSPRPLLIDFRGANNFDDVELIRQRYNAAVAWGWGMSMQVLCRCGNVTCCYLAVPRDAEQADCEWMTTFRMASPEPCPEGTAVTNRLRWWWLRKGLRRRIGRVTDSWLANIPLRDAPLDP